MRRWLLLFFTLVTVFSSDAIAQEVKWHFYAQPLNGNEFLLNFKAELKDGWYIYSTRPHEINKPTQIEFSDDKDLVKKDKVQEYGDLIKKEDPDLETTFYKYANEVTFQIPVAALKDDMLQEGKVVFQICDDKSCLPIDSEKFRFRLKSSTDDQQLVSKAIVDEGKQKDIVQLNHPIAKTTPVATNNSQANSTKTDPSSVVLSKGYTIVKSKTYTDYTNQDKSGEIIVIPDPAPLDVATIHKQEKPTSQVINFYDASKPTQMNIDKTVKLSDTDALVVGNVASGKKNKANTSNKVKRAAQTVRKNSTTAVVKNNTAIDQLINSFNQEMSTLPTDKVQAEEENEMLVIKEDEKVTEESESTLLAMNEETDKEEEVTEESDEEEGTEEEDETAVAPMIVAQNPVAWNFSQEVLENGQVKLVFEANVEDGWHLYSAKNQGNAPTGLLMSFNETITASNQLMTDATEVETLDPIFMKPTGKYVGKVVFSKVVDWNQKEALAGSIQYMCGGTDKYTQLQTANFSFDATSVQTEKETPVSKSTLNNWWWMIGLAAGIVLLVLARYFTPQIMTNEE